MDDHSCIRVRRDERHCSYSCACAPSLQEAQRCEKVSCQRILATIFVRIIASGQTDCWIPSRRTRLIPVRWLLFMTCTWDLYLSIAFMVLRTNNKAIVLIFSRKGCFDHLLPPPSFQTSQIPQKVLILLKIRIKFYVFLSLSSHAFDIQVCKLLPLSKGLTSFLFYF